MLANVTFGASWSVLVLYATQRLGMDEVGFGLLAAMFALAARLFLAVILSEAKNPCICFSHSNETSCFDTKHCFMPEAEA